jgi:transcriptional regulator with PAS, ATPase and Fis domain
MTHPPGKKAILMNGSAVYIKMLINGETGTGKQVQD